MRSSACPASATSRSSASASIRCGSGSIRIGMAARQITASDVVNALREQNVQVAAGSLGQAPAPAGQMYQLSVRAVGRLTRRLGVRQHHPEGGRRTALVRLKDVGRCRARRRDLLLASCAFKGRRGVGFGVIQLPTANALDVDEAMVAELEPAVAAVSARDEVPGRLQHDRRRPGIDSRGAEDAGGSDRPRRPRHFHLPADLAQHDHSGHHDSGVAHRRVRVHQAAGLFHQHADALRRHPRHRHRRRRRDRGDREHRAAHPGIQGLGASGGVGRDGRGA